MFCRRMQRFLLSCLHMLDRLKSLAIPAGIIVALGLVFTFLPQNPNRLLMQPLLAEKEIVPADIGVVLGAGLKLDGSLSNIAKERVDYALEIHKQSGLPLLFSGGETSRGIEAVSMNAYAKQNGYTGLDHMEASSHSTYDNAKFTDQLLDNGRFPDTTVQIITSPYHSRRALAVFRKLMPDRRVFITYPDETVIMADTALGRWRGLYTLMREYAANLWYAAAYRVSPNMQPTEFVKGERLDFQMQDGVRIQGDYYAGVTDKGVILLHMLGRDRHLWDDVIPALQEKGWHVLAVDLRGHGQSEGIYRTFSEADFQKMPIDVIALSIWMQQNHGPMKVVAMGASIGANSAVRAASLSDQIQAVVALSPGNDYRGVNIAGAVRDVGVPILYVSSKDDSQSSQAFPGLLNNTGTPGREKSLIMYDSGGHGTDLFATQADLLSRIISFIDGL